jgi:hypothetical protein
MLMSSASQSTLERHHTTTTVPNVDRHVRDTYHDLLNLPVPERFIQLVQSYPEQQQTGPADKDRGSHAPLFYRCLE